MGLVIKFEGIDGSGKTSLISRIAKDLRSEFKILVTKEFGSPHDIIRYRYENIKISSFLREISFDKNINIDSIERELLMAVASRRNNRLIIHNNVNKYDIILCDRSDASNYAYGQEVSSRLSCVFDIALSDIEICDLYIFIDTPIDICMHRISPTGTDPVEANDFDYFERVRDSYYHFFSNIENVFFVDGSLSKSKIDEIVKQEILNRIPPVTSS